jgi:hypothetical protein
MNSAQKEQYQQNQADLEAESTVDHEEHVMENTHQKLAYQEEKVHYKKMAHQEERRIRRWLRNPPSACVDTCDKWFTVISITHRNL